MKLVYYLFILLSVCVSREVNAQSTQDSIPLHENFTISSSYVGEERKINVWTPETYIGSATPLPVLYMLDGGIQEDFPHLAKTMQELIAAHKIPPFRLVGIENTQRRRDLTGPTTVANDKRIAPVVGESAKFRNFIKEELIPTIEKNYPTSSKRGIIGESLAGLFIAEIFLMQPELFDYYIAFDPSIWWNKQQLVKELPKYITRLPNTKKLFWFAASSEKTIEKPVRKFSKKLKELNPKDLQWKVVFAPKETHATIFKTLKEEALIWTLNK